MNLEHSKEIGTFKEEEEEKEHWRVPPQARAGRRARTRARKRFDHLVSTRAQLTDCPRCHVAILTGLADGLSVHVELFPVDPHVEVAALLTGRESFVIISGTLARRTGSRTHRPVHVEHRCGLTLGLPPEPVEPTDFQDQIPF